MADQPITSRNVKEPSYADPIIPLITDRQRDGCAVSMAGCYRNSGRHHAEGFAHMN